MSEGSFVNPDEGASLATPFGDRIRWVAGARDGEPAYSLHERSAPPGAASFPHTHGRVSEAFYVLSGEFEFQLGERRLDGGAGTFVHAPRGVAHAWRVKGAEPARALVVFAPGVAPGFFEELDAETRAPGGPSRERLLAINEKYGLGP